MYPGPSLVAPPPPPPPPPLMPPPSPPSPPDVVVAVPVWVPTVNDESDVTVPVTLLFALSIVTFEIVTH